MNLTSVNGDTASVAMMQGETVALALQYIPVKGGVPQNVNGYSFKAQIGFPVPLLLTSANGGFVVLDSFNGIIQMNIASTQTSGMPTGSYPFDVWATSPGGQEIPWVSGLVILMSTETPLP